MTWWKAYGYETGHYLTRGRGETVTYLVVALKLAAVHAMAIAS
jgi:hypothetical protein